MNTFSVKNNNIPQNQVIKNNPSSASGSRTYKNTHQINELPDQIEGVPQRYEYYVRSRNTPPGPSQSYSSIEEVRKVLKCSEKKVAPNPFYANHIYIDIKKELDSKSINDIEYIINTNRELLEAFFNIRTNHEEKNHKKKNKIMKKFYQKYQQYIQRFFCIYINNITKSSFFDGKNTNQEHLYIATNNNSINHHANKFREMIIYHQMLNTVLTASMIKDRIDSNSDFSVLSNLFTSIFCFLEHQELDSNLKSFLEKTDDSKSSSEHVEDIIIYRILFDARLEITNNNLIENNFSLEKLLFIQMKARIDRTKHESSRPKNQSFSKEEIVINSLYTQIKEVGFPLLDKVSEQINYFIESAKTIKQNLANSSLEERLNLDNTNHEKTPTNKPEGEKVQSAKIMTIKQFQHIEQMNEEQLQSLIKCVEEISTHLF
jgi:hypothetical protein